MQRQRQLLEYRYKHSLCIVVCFKGAFNRPHRKRILGITHNSFKGYTSSQYTHKATNAKQRYKL